MAQSRILRGLAAEDLYPPTGRCNGHSGGGRSASHHRHKGGYSTIYFRCEGRTLRKTLALPSDVPLRRTISFQRNRTGNLPAPSVRISGQLPLPPLQFRVPPSTKRKGTTTAWVAKPSGAERRVPGCLKTGPLTGRPTSRATDDLSEMPTTRYLRSAGRKQEPPTKE